MSEPQQSTMIEQMQQFNEKVLRPWAQQTTRNFEAFRRQSEPLLADLRKRRRL